MENSKIRTYLGFCIKARKIIYGAESISRQKRGIHLLIVDGSVGKNTLKPILQASENFACPVVMTETDALAGLVNKPAAKAVAITDQNLASAILSVVGSDAQFKLYSGGNN